MALDPEMKDLVAGLPDRVVNELAILEDRALRAENRADRAEYRLVELREDLARSRAVIEELETIAKQLLARAEALETQAREDRASIEAALQHVLVTGARR